MHVELLVSHSRPCRSAVKVWQELCAECGVSLAVTDTAAPSQAQVAARKAINVVPAVLIDGELVAVGVQQREEARRLLTEHRRQSYTHSNNPSDGPD